MMYSIQFYLRPVWGGGGGGGGEEKYSTDYQQDCYLYFKKKIFYRLPYIPRAELDTANTDPASAKMFPKIGCQYRAVTGMITPVCTWRPILAQNLAANTCFRHSKGPMLCRTLVFSLPEWFAVVKVTHGPVMCRLWAGLWLL